MTSAQWDAFRTFRDEFKAKCLEWSELQEMLFPLQRAASQADTPLYPLENAVVYSRDFDTLTPQDDIKLIVIGDNPGKDEQLHKNRRYLVGQAGKIAEGFFRRNPELGIDFRKHVLILNKTPVHTAKTAHLRKLLKEPTVYNLIQQSQCWMAQHTAVLHRQLIAGAAPETPQDMLPAIWLVGYAELKGRGLFISYRNKLLEGYHSAAADFSDHVFVYQHFSMNRFLIDLSNFRKEYPELTLSEALHELGSLHRTEIFC